MPKFDAAIMNPPYDRNLHLKILEKVIPIAEKVVNISPVRWLQDPFANVKKSTLKRFEQLAKAINDIQTLDGTGNTLFNICAYSDLGVYTIDSNDTNKIDYKNFWKRTRSDKEISILNKVCFSACEKISDKAEQNKIDGIRVLITGIAGNRGFLPIIKDFKYCEDGFVNGTIWYKAKNMGGYEKAAGSPLPGSLKFGTSKEAENFYDSYKTKFLIYICKISVQQQNIQVDRLPFMQDYTQPWDDKRFCAYFGITGYIDDEHAEPNSEWETILNTMKEYV